MRVMALFPHIFSKDIYPCSKTSEPRCTNKRNSVGTFETKKIVAYKEKPKTKIKTLCLGTTSKIKNEDLNDDESVSQMWKMM